MTMLLLSWMLTGQVWAQDAFSLSTLSDQTWEQGFVVPVGGRPNPYQVSESELPDVLRKGAVHTLVYPVGVTGMLLPERPLKSMIDGSSQNPFRKILSRLFQGFAKVKSYNDLFRWVGLHDYPRNSEAVPYPADVKPDYLMGYSRIVREGVTGFTISCAGCHVSNLFGDKILGMTNRFPRANQVFVQGQKMAKIFNQHWFRPITGATKAETAMMVDSLAHLKSVGLKQPLQLGLDTSLAQVALSLNKRAPNAWAEKSEYFEKHPRADILDQTPGDSKPAVWWNLKYKNRWLSDGSVVAGNPIYTNILWNEIGRGTDLRELDKWLGENGDVIRELTTRVFSTEAPRIEKYFPEDKIIRERALAGEVVFNSTCSKCHGSYVKNWSLPEHANSPWKEQIKTAFVKYPQQTRVMDVGTDPNRYLTMKSLEKLNALEISQRQGIKIAAQKGYVPPPLVGIWARWPYMHNNSVPSLCAVLTPASKRPAVYYAGEALDTTRDFDFECNGYPSGQRVPVAWKKREFLYDTSREGMRNSGHDEGIFLRDGREILTGDDKRNLIQFLQTL